MFKQYEYITVLDRHKLMVSVVSSFFLLVCKNVVLISFLRNWASRKHGSERPDVQAWVERYLSNEPKRAWIGDTKGFSWPYTWPSAEGLSNSKPYD